MRAARRPPVPDILARHGRRWSQDYVRKRRIDPAYRFQWRKYNRQRVNIAIMPYLRAMTQEHCAYCDGYPLDHTAFETIDHFLPKSLYPHLSYAWENLYLACPMCQMEKGSNFDIRIDPKTYDDALLRPDDRGYRFERYFLVNYEKGTIEVNPRARPADRKRAAYTIRSLGLNQGSRPQSRKRQIRHFARLSPEERQRELDDFPYRFMLEG